MGWKRQEFGLRHHYVALSIRHTGGNAKWAVVKETTLEV